MSPQPAQPQPSEAQRTAEARAAFTASLNSVGTNLDADLRSRAANLHENAAVIAKQEADLKRATTDLARQNDQWQKVADQAREGLKEIGDVQNWAELIERDLLVLDETLRLVEEKNPVGESREVDGLDGEGDGEAVNTNTNANANANANVNGDAVGKVQEPVREGRWRWW